MAQQLIPNRWHLRRVADSSARSCFICYKPSTSVLITPDNKDFFYICPIHLKDKGFCSPVIDEEAVAASKKKDELDREIEKVKKEYEEKMKRKKGKDNDKPKADAKDKPDQTDKKDDDDQKAEKEKDDKIKALQATATATTGASGGADDDTPRIYTLHKNFYQMRIDRIRSQELAKRNRERMKSASFFPSTPKGDI